MQDPRSELVKRLKWQAAGCRILGSPFYGSVLESAMADVESGGPVWTILEPFLDEHRDSALTLRMLGAVHRLVLLDELPRLAGHYPSVGGDGDAAAAWPIFRDALSERHDELTALIRRGCQTNEVGRSAALFGGFLEVADRSRKPLRILELGASAGLNLRWDRFRYVSTAGAWGDESSPVQFAHSFEIPPPMNRTVEVVERRGCDVNPIDPTSEEGALTLRSFIWADQLGRMSQLDGAIQIASEMPVEVERIGAADFLERELARSRPDVATVVYHSVFMQYVSPSERERIVAAIAGADVFHLRMEPAYPLFEVRLGGELLGTSYAHGTHVRWNVDSGSQ